MMPSAVVDTNLLVRIATGDIPAQARKAVSLIKSYSKHEIILPECVLAEVAFVLHSKKSYNLPRHLVADSLQEILDIEQLWCNQDLLGEAVRLYRDTNLDFVDCVLLGYVKLSKAEKLLSFDTALLKAI